MCDRTLTMEIQKVCDRTFTKELQKRFSFQSIIFAGCFPLVAVGMLVIIVAAVLVVDLI